MRLNDTGYFDLTITNNVNIWVEKHKLFFNDFNLNGRLNKSKTKFYQNTVIYRMVLIRFFLIIPSLQLLH